MPREWDTESVRSGGPRNYTTVRRYKVPDRGGYEDDRYETDIKITNREGDQDISYEREVDRGGRASRNVREIKVTRELDRAPSPPSPVRGWRVEREGSRRGGPYELERYSRETEYMREPDRYQQPIIIRQEAPAPIIIRESAPPQEIVIREERREEPKFEMVESRSVVNEKRSDDNRSVANRSVVRRDPSPQSEEEDDYYYKRTTRQIARRSDGREEERDAYRREVDPRDSASQYGDDRSPDRGGGSGQSDDDGYYSRKTTKTTEEWNDPRDPHHRRHIAEGAVAGLAGAALLQHQQRKSGKKPGGAAQLAGGAALGALGVEVLSRAKKHLEGDRSRSRGRGRGGGGRSRSRTGSAPHVSNVAKIGAVAVLGALAGYAVNRQRKAAATDNDRRSRSRRRRGSVDRDRSGSGSEDRSRGISNNRATIAKAGLASAAVAGLVDRMRSKSRGGRSRSLGRSAIPVAAAGLGGAALAGLYNRNKQQNQQREVEDDSPVRASRSRRKSRSRSRSAPNFRSEPDTTPNNQQNLVVYGGDPIPPANQYARNRSRDSYYSDPGRQRARGSPDSSRSSSPRQRRSRSRRRDEGAASAGLAGAAAAASANEASQRRERKRAERERRRLEEERNETPQAYPQNWGPYAEPVPATLPGTQQNQYFPQTNQFPPPPNTASPVPVGNYNYPAYNPTEYNAQAATPVGAQNAGVAGASGGQWGYPPPGGQQPYPGHYNVSSASYTPEQRDLGSSLTSPLPSWRESGLTDRRSDGMSETAGPTAAGKRPTRQRRKSVQFNLKPFERKAANHEAAAADASEAGAGRGRPGSRRTQHEERRSHSADDATPIRYPQKAQRRRHRGDDAARRAHSPASDDSESTILLPDRFDRDGRRKADQGGDALADTLEDMLNGRGPAGKLFHRFAGDLVGVRMSRW